MDRLMPAPYTIRIFVADGDPEGVRIIDRFNWTGKGYRPPPMPWGIKRSELSSTLRQWLPSIKRVDTRSYGFARGPKKLLLAGCRSSRSCTICRRRLRTCTPERSLRSRCSQAPTDLRYLWRREAA
jgi:hypothetical protein